MVKTELTDEEKKLIIEALNNNTEPPPELMTKLFPGLAVWGLGSWGLGSSLLLTLALNS